MDEESGTKDFNAGKSKITKESKDDSHEKKEEFKNDLNSITEDKEKLETNQRKENTLGKNDGKLEVTELEEASFDSSQIEGKNCQSKFKWNSNGSATHHALLPEDPKIGTFNKLTALFTFRKLNRTISQDSQSSLIFSDSFESNLPMKDTAGDVASFPEDNFCLASPDDVKHCPPPLPPKPNLDSLVRKNLGTRVVNY